MAASEITYTSGSINKSSIVKKLRNLFIVEKFKNPLGYLILILIASFISFGLAAGKVAFAAEFFICIIAIPFLYSFFAFPKFSLTFLLTLGFMFFLLVRYGVEGPVGTLFDGFQLLLILNILGRQKSEKKWYLFNNSVSYVLLIWLIYNIIEAINPESISIVPWFYTVRTTAFVLFTFFSFVFFVRDVKFIRFYLKLYLVLNIAGALYGFKQEFIGFSDVENAYLNSDPNIASLLFIGGHWRKFSIFSDPVSFAYNMNVASIICLALLTGPFSIVKKLIITAIGVTCYWASLYSGTRGAFVLLPAAFAMFALFKWSSKMLVAVIILSFLFVAAVKVPTSNGTLYRFQSAFSPNTDPSYLLRKYNQKRIQPYILTHPMGGGLGSTGLWGNRFAPDSYLAHFQPDSGYIRVAVEEGWIGLIILCIMLFTFIKVGIDNYYTIKDPELKCYAMASTLGVFTFNVANFPQESLVQYPSNIVFCFFVALTVVLKRLDNEKSAKKLAEHPAQLSVNDGDLITA